MNGWVVGWLVGRWERLDKWMERWTSQRMRGPLSHLLISTIVYCHLHRPPPLLPHSSLPPPPLRPLLCLPLPSPPSSLLPLRRYLSSRHPNTLEGVLYLWFQSQGFTHQECILLEHLGGKGAPARRHAVDSKTIQDYSRLCNIHNRHTDMPWIVRTI